MNYYAASIRDRKVSSACTNNDNQFRKADKENTRNRRNITLRITNKLCILSRKYDQNNTFIHMSQYSHRRCSVKKCVLKISALLTRKHLCFFSIKLGLQLLLKRDSNAGVFLENLRNFSEHLRMTASDERDRYSLSELIQ